MQAHFHVSASCIIVYNLTVFKKTRIGSLFFLFWLFLLLYLADIALMRTDLTYCSLCFFYVISLI